jgi:hypothetical protein
MTDAHQTQRDVFIETPTEYEIDVDCDHPISIYISDPNPDSITYLCQQLSLFVETHDEELVL